MTVLDKHLLRPFVSLYTVLTGIAAVLSAGIVMTNAPDSSLTLLLPLIAVPATIAAGIALSHLSEQREIMAMFAAGISPFRIALPIMLCSCIFPTLAVAVEAVFGSVSSVLVQAVLGAGASVVGISIATITSAEFARRDSGVVWLSSIGILLLYYFGASKYMNLGKHLVFDVWCTALMTAAFLILVWQLPRIFRSGGW